MDVSGLVCLFLYFPVLISLSKTCFDILSCYWSPVNELPGSPRPSRRRGTDADVRDAWVGPTPWDQEEAGI